MVTRLRVIFLGVGMLSTVVGCAVAPPTMPPPVVMPPASAPPVGVPPAPVVPPRNVPPEVSPPVVAPRPYSFPPSATGHREIETYQPSPYERQIDEEVARYRQRRSEQEREQERAFQQWQQELERQRDPGRWER